MSTFQERIGGLRWRLRALRRLFRPGAQPDETFLPRVEGPDLTEGMIDHPGPGYVFEEDTMGFIGWVTFADSSPVGRVEGTLDGTPIGRARVSIPRPDVDEQRDHTLAHLSGFDLTAEISLLPADVRTGARELRVIATSASGERFEFDEVPIMLRPRPWVLDPPTPAPAPLVAPPRRADLRVLVFTHQLTLGGAQLYLLDLLRELHSREEIELTLVSAIDGPVRKDLEAIGIDVHLTAMAPFEKPTGHLGRIGEMAAWLRDGEFDVAFINTATSGASFGAEIARSLDIPAVWAIHESFPPGILWADLNEKVREFTEGTLAQARFAIFEADATRRIYESLIPTERCLTIPYGVDVEPIEKERHALDRTAARERLGIPASAELAVCVGTVEPRKAQVQLAQAFSMIADRHPQARIAFVGARTETPNTEDLEAVIAESDYADRIDVIEVTPEVQVWYGIADLLVCASDVESLPRTVLEAMLWETPVLATAVFGIPDVIEDGVTGWLCEPRDLAALADGLDRAFSTPTDERRRIATAARKLIEERHDLSRYAAAVLETLQRAVSESTDGHSA